MEQSTFTFNFLAAVGDHTERISETSSTAAGKQVADEGSADDSRGSPVLNKANSNNRPFRWVENVHLLLEDRSQEELIYKEIPIANGAGATTSTATSTFLRVVDLHFSSYQRSKPNNNDDGDETTTGDDVVEYAHTIKSDQTTTDIVSGVYEGGAKVWECSLDLVQYLATVIDTIGHDDVVKTAGHDGGRSFKVWEIGCGHGLPGCYLLHKWIVQCPKRLRRRHRNSEEDGDDENNDPPSPCWSVTFSDYNEEVILDATISNIVLNAQIGMPIVASRDDNYNNANNALRTEDGKSSPSTTTTAVTSEEQQEQQCDDDTTIIKVDDVGRHIRLGFGDWMDQSATMVDHRTDHRENDDDDETGRETFDLILAAETIYTEQACRDTVRLLLRHLFPIRGVAYIATKRYYFGVGGGVDCFKAYAGAAATTASRRRLHVDTVQVIDNGSGNIREILKVTIN